MLNNKGTEDMPTIELSQATFSRLQKLAQPFVDTPEDVIRRLLEGIGSHNGEDPETIEGRDLVSRAGRAPHGSKLIAVYKGTQFEAHVDDGKVVWNGRSFNSLSEAAVAVIRSTGSNRPTENGWRFWRIVKPGSKG